MAEALHLVCLLSHWFLRYKPYGRVWILMVYIFLDLVNLKQMILVMSLCISTLLALERAGISNSLVPKMTGNFTSKPPDDGCRLVLGLGPSPMACSGNKQTNLSSSSLLPRLLDDNGSNLKPLPFGETEDSLVL